LPTGIAAFPFWRVVADALDHCPRAAELAQRFDMLVFSDVGTAISRSATALTGTAVVASMVSLFLVPFVAGMILASGRAERSVGFVALLHGGLAWYARMFRMVLVSLVPLALVAVVATFAFKGALRYAEHVTLESHAERASYAALAATALLFVLVHATIEAGRAELGADHELRSALRAWVRGVRLTTRRPFTVLRLYLATTIASWAIAAVVLVIRLRVSGGTEAGVWLGFLLTQLAVVAIGWGKASRLLALTALVRAHARGA